MSPPTRTGAPVEAFARQLRSQAGLYGRVLAVSRRQQEALEADDFATFSSWLAEKTGMMQEITALELAMAPNRALFEAQRDTVPDVMRAELRTAVEDIRRLLEHLIEVEQACEGYLEASKQGVVHELRDIGQGQRALQSYRPAPPPPAPPRLDLGG